MTKFSKNKIFQKRARQGGFSMIEAVLSMFILTVGILATVSLMSKNMKQSISARDSIVASNLAQEGLELVRNLRDNNLASKQAGGAFCTDSSQFNPENNIFCSAFPAVSSNNCRVSRSWLTVTCAAGDQSLNIATATNFFEHVSAFGNITTKFRRRINVTNLDANTRKIESQVVWGKSAFPAVCNLGNNCISAQDILTSR